MYTQVSTHTSTAYVNNSICWSLVVTESSIQQIRVHNVFLINHAITEQANSSCHSSVGVVGDRRRIVWLVKVCNKIDKTHDKTYAIN